MVLTLQNFLLLHQLSSFKHITLSQPIPTPTFIMSDAGRKDFSTKAKEEITPDSTKSTQDKVKETVTDTSDRVARGFQTDDSKGAGQEVFDKTQRSHDNNAHGGASGSVVDKAKNLVGLGNK